MIRSTTCKISSLVFPFFFFKNLKSFNAFSKIFLSPSEREHRFIKTFSILLMRLSMVRICFILDILYKLSKGTTLPFPHCQYRLC